MKKTKLKEKGITLIALVVTIIVLIILATVSINMILNEDGGIIGAAEKSKELYQNAAAKEQTDLQQTEGELQQYLPKTYTAYAVGDEITINGEKFYVIKVSGKDEERVTMITEKGIDINTLEQSESPQMIAFSTSNYWSSSIGSNESFNLNTNTTEAQESIATVIAKARAYGAKNGLNGQGRLLTKEEAEALDETILTKITGYWLGSAKDSNYVWYVRGFSPYICTGNPYSYVGYGVRPVVEVSKEDVTITLVTDET